MCSFVIENRLGRDVYHIIGRVSVIRSCCFCLLLFVCLLFVRLSVFGFVLFVCVCVFVCLFVRLFVCLFVCV